MTAHDTFIINSLAADFFFDVKGLVRELNGEKRAHASGDVSLQLSAPASNGTNITSPLIKGGIASSAATQGKRPSWMPEFVGGVGGGANDPAYKTSGTSGSVTPAPATNRVIQTTSDTKNDPAGSQEENGSSVGPVGVLFLNSSRVVVFNGFYMYLSCLTLAEERHLGWPFPTYRPIISSSFR